MLASKTLKFNISKTPSYRFSKSLLLNKKKILSSIKEPYCIFFHGTSNSTKLWDNSYWEEIGEYLNTNVL